MSKQDNTTLAMVQTQLNNLPIGEHKLTDIVAVIQSCDTFQQETLDSFIAAIFDIDDGQSMCKLDELYIDLHYQRKLKLKNLINNLKIHKGFSKEKAGHIDISIRPNGKKYVWDGFRRAVKALLCGMKEIAVSQYTHKRSINNTAARQYEADLFIARNAKNETMGANEIFFARFAKGEKEAIDMQTVLSRANINVCGLKPNGANMGGFAFVEKCLGYHERMEGELVNKSITDDDFVFASSTIQQSWVNEKSVGAYVVCALANVRQVLRNDISDYSDRNIENRLSEYAKSNKQKDLSDRRLSNKPLQSVTFNILKMVMKLNGKSKKLSSLTDDEIDLMDDNN